MKKLNKPLIASASAALMLGLGSQAAVAENPFAAEPMSSGYNQLASSHAGEKDGEGKCGEGKCGEGKKDKEHKDRDGKCGEAKCGEDKKDREKKKDGEGKCGEGKCGA